jgi:AmmeMemoRadiSam system protein B
LTAVPLPRLRTDLDFIPSPFPDRPGLLIRDPHRYSDATLIIPPALVGCLGCFDGETSELDLRDMLAKLTGTITVGDIAARIVNALEQSGMLDDHVYAGLKADRHREFAAAPARSAAHAGGAYPLARDELMRTLAGYIGAPTAGPAPPPLIGIAAPHVSPEGAPSSYGAAYRALPPDLHDRTFVILGTSHYGQPNRFGLTRKPFATPLGSAETDGALVAQLEAAAGDAVKMEDYCHAIEHSIEFQVLFLQHLFGPRLRILPILCGPLTHGANGVAPDRSEAVARFVGALGELAAREASRLFWVLGVDMTHVGRRYGDGFSARAHEGPLAAVGERDQRRIDRIAAGDAGGFWDLIHDNPDDRRHDELKWCGTSPIYTFLRAVPQARGQLLRYDQWNIDAESVVSFAAMTFR